MTTHDAQSQKATLSPSTPWLVVLSSGRTQRTVPRTTGVVERPWRVLAVAGYAMSDSYTPPAGVQRAGKRALELLKDGKAGSNFTGAGRARASQLANGHALSKATIKRMHSYFSRHSVDRKPGWSDKGKESPGYVAWLAWGGDAGKAWSAKMVRSFEAGTKSDGLLAVVDELDSLIEGLVYGTETAEYVEDNIDGSQCKSVLELAYANDCTEFKAALLACESKDDDLAEAGREWLTTMRPGPERNKTGVAIMLVPTRNDAVQMAMPDGEPWSELHCTLYFAGSTQGDDQVSGRGLEVMQEACHTVAWNHGPVNAKANGISRFTGDEGQDPIVVNIDSPELPKLYNTLMEALWSDPDVNLRPPNHGFTPHMTLGYVAQDSESPIRRWQTRDVRFERIELWAGTDHQQWLLGAVDPLEPGEYAEEPGEDGNDAEPAIVPPSQVPMREEWKDVHGPMGNMGKRKKTKRAVLVDRLRYANRGMEIKQ